MTHHDVAAACALRHGGNPTKLLQILREMQTQSGHLGPEAIDAVANALGLPRVRVEATATFYHLLHAESRGVYEILFSDNIVDHMQGKRELMAYLCERMWLAPERVSEDGLVYVGSTSDIGLGDQGPAALINGWPLPLLDHNRLDLIAGLIRNRKPLADWPSMLFEVAPNIRRGDALLAEPHAAGSAIARVLETGAEGMLEELERASPRGRGGAGFKTAVKWASCRSAPGRLRYVICNADEGEPGTFKDRALLQEHADLVFDGMTVAARVVGAKHGLLYLRGEYLFLVKALEAVLQRRREDGLLGNRILGEAGFDFDIAIDLGAGAYICGEESALIESAEGKAGPTAQPTAVSGHVWLSRAADRRQQRRDLCLRREDRGARRRLVRGDRHAGVDRHEDPFGVRRLRAARHLRISVRRHRAPRARRLRRAAPACGAGRRPFRHLPFVARIRSPHRVRGRPHRRRLHGVRTRARHVRSGPQLHPFLRARKLRFLHAVPRRHVALEQPHGQARGGEGQRLRHAADAAAHAHHADDEPLRAGAHGGEAGASRRWRSSPRPTSGG